MDFSRLLSYSMIVIGGIIAFYAQAGSHQNQYILVAGIFILMMGIYRISRNIPSKSDQDHSKNRNDEF